MEWIFLKWLVIFPEGFPGDSNDSLAEGSVCVLQANSRFQVGKKVIMFGYASKLHTLVQYITGQIIIFHQPRFP